MIDETRPVYTIGTAAEILGVHPRTLRLYEEGGLLRPARKNNRRLYSGADLVWIRCLRYLIHEQGLNQEGLRRLLARIPCAQIRSCPPEANVRCPAGASTVLPCWAMSAGRSNGAKKCFACQVYLSAKNHLLDESQLEEAMRYAQVA
jgi:MerR family transcriptional regulator/heat shock protein HspR